MSRSKRKGSAYERAVRDYFRDLGVYADRHLGQARDGGADVDTDLPLAVECKCRARHDWWGTLDQVVAAAKPGEIPVAFLKQTFGPGRPGREGVLLTRDGFLSMVRALVEAGVWPDDRRAA